MGTILDYLANYGKKDVKEHPLNELDYAIINELGYLPLGESEYPLPLCFSTVRAQLENWLDHLPESFLVTRERVVLFKAVLQAPRFEDLTLVRYTNRVAVDLEQQFAAMVFTLETIAHRQLVFRGTDATLIGWKEDFNMAYMREIPAQRSSMVFLKEVLEDDNYPIVLSGHSKGGNLAVYAASHQEQAFQDKITSIYLFDAPGLHPLVLTTEGYGRVQSLIRAVRPYESVVGVMLARDWDVAIVKSDKLGFEQHNLNNWQISDNQFERVPEPSPLSQILEKTFQLWLSELSRQELKVFIDTIFNLFWDTGIQSLDDFQTDPQKKWGAVMAEVSQMPQEKRQLIGKSVISLLTLYVQERYKQKPKWTPDNFFDLFQSKKWLK